MSHDQATAGIPVEDKPKLPPGIVHRIKLKEPVQLGSEETDVVAHLDFPRLKGKHLRCINSTAVNIDQLLNVAEVMTKVPTSVFDNLGVDDAREVCGYVMEKLGPFLQGAGGVS